MEVTILAVTNALGGRYCIAGMTNDGQWIRPIQGRRRNRFWSHDDLSFEGGEFATVGDVWHIEGIKPNELEYENHVEDYLVHEHKYVHTLSCNQLWEFVKDRVEDQGVFQETVNANGRSLCLVEVHGYKYHIYDSDKGPKAKMRISNNNYNIDNPHTSWNDYIVKDCKWEGLIINGNEVPQFEQAYVCIGLATKFRGVEWPQIIGFHTNTYVPHLDQYPNY
jgi:hypothetical protein